MMRLFDFLAQTKILWTSFLATVFLTIGFGVVMSIWDFGIIDELYNAERIVNHIDAMTPAQRTVHAWMTGTIDVAYPFAYGSFFIGMARRYFPKYGHWLALPSALVIPFDLLEGITQIMLLRGHYQYVDAKVIITPIKLGLFGAGLMITLAAVFIAVFRRPPLR